MKKFLSLALALVMTMSLVTVSAGAKGFTDNSKIQYNEAVEVMSAAKVIDGYTDGSFNPSAELTRGAAAKIICNLILGPTTASALRADTAPYKDVPVNHTFAGYIAYCAKEGIISGYADKNFRPAATLTSYAFMKMLLGALGYDAEVEQYVGPNWSINVAKRALNIGLDDGLKKDFVGTNAVTREEACLYALNTMMADMVEYDSKTSVTVGGAEVIIAGSEAKTMKNTTKTDGKVFAADGEMQFAEKYFDNLSVKKGADDFERPANVWKLKAEEIGTYADEADKTYTEKVEAGDIYKDLDLGKAIDKKDVTVYVNGVEDSTNAPAFALKKGSDTKVGVSGNGVLTEVFYDNDNDTVTITQVLTYVGEVIKTVKATDKKDAYIQIDTSLSGNAPRTAGRNNEFETNEKFEDEAKVLFTFSEKADEIKSVALAEKVEGTVTKVVNKSNDTDNSKVTLAGTEYKASKTLISGILAAISVDQDYTAYLDQYGYVIHVDEEDYKDYALVLAIQGTGSNNFDTNRAKLLFTDGTEKVVDLAKNYSTKGIAQNDIVTYKKQDDGDYILKEVMHNKAAATKSVTDSEKFNLKNDNAKINVGKTSDDFVHANSKTMFVVKDGASDWNAYVGVKAAPSVKAQDLNNNGFQTGEKNEKVTAYWYCKSGTMVTAMFIVPGSDALVSDDNNDMLFLAGESVSDLNHDSKGDYYEYQAYVNGEIKTVMVDSSVSSADSLNGLYSNYSVDSDGIITRVTPYTTTNTLDKFSGAGVGTDKNSGDYTVTVLNGTNKGTWTVDDDAKFFDVDKDGNITVGSYASVTKDNDDKTYFVIENGMIIFMFVEEVNTKDDVQAPSTLTIAASSETPVAGETVKLSSKIVLNDKKNDKIVGYQWTKDNKDIIGATEDTYTFTAGTDTDGKYKLKVTVFNGKVDGKDEATFTSNEVTVNSSAKVEKTKVAVYFSTDGTKTNVVDTAVVEVAVQGGVLATVKQSDVTVPTGYKYVSGLPASITIGGTPEVIVTVAAKSTVTTPSVGSFTLAGTGTGYTANAVVGSDNITITVSGGNSNAAQDDTLTASVTAPASGTCDATQIVLTYNGTNSKWEPSVTTVNCTAESGATQAYTVTVA